MQGHLYAYAPPADVTRRGGRARPRAGRRVHVAQLRGRQHRRGQPLQALRRLPSALLLAQLPRGQLASPPARLQGGHRGAQGARVCARRRALRGAARPVEAEVEAEAEVEVEAAAQSESPAAATVRARVEALPTRALKAELAARGVSVLGLSERRELVEALLSAPAVVVAEETEVAAAAAAPVEGAASAAAASAASAVPPDAVESTALWPANIRRECAASSQWLNGPLAANLAAAEHSDAAAQNAMGFRYNEGDGVPHDLAHAALWYRKAADQVFASAQYILVAPTCWARACRDPTLTPSSGGDSRLLWASLTRSTGSASFTSTAARVSPPTSTSPCASTCSRPLPASLAPSLTSGALTSRPRARSSASRAARLHAHVVGPRRLLLGDLRAPQGQLRRRGRVVGVDAARLVG